jgi:hypothetical protein
MAKGTKIEGRATITRIGSTTNGMAWETPIAHFALDGNEYCWISDKIEWISLQQGESVNLRAFVRPDGTRLYSVTVSR